MHKINLVCSIAPSVLNGFYFTLQMRCILGVGGGGVGGVMDMLRVMSSRLMNTVDIERP